MDDETSSSRDVGSAAVRRLREIISLVDADFRDEEAYFTTAFDLILSLYEIPFDSRAVADLRESLVESDRLG